MKEIIKITKKYLIFRDDAKVILENIQEKGARGKAQGFVLDLAGVEFMSRSFADELLNVISKLEDKDAKIDLINLRPNLQKFMASIQKRKQAIRKELEAVGV